RVEYIAIDIGELLDKFDRLLLIFINDVCQRVEIVEQKMRVNLVLQAFILRDNTFILDLFLFHEGRLPMQEEGTTMHEQRYYDRNCNGAVDGVRVSPSEVDIQPLLKYPHEPHYRYERVAHRADRADYGSPY